MAFKNSLKLFFRHFRLFWILLLYMLIVMVVLSALGAASIVNIIKEIKASGLSADFYTLYLSIIRSVSPEIVFENLKTLAIGIKDLFFSSRIFSLNSTLLVVLIFIIVNRFLTGLAEIPILSVLDMRLSSNASVGFTACYISKLGVSCRYILAKMLYTIIFDAVIFTAVYFIAKIIFTAGMLWAGALILFFALWILLTLKTALTAMWGPSIVSGEKKIWSGFVFSVKKCFRHFKTLLASSAGVWLIILVSNLFFGIFTFGAGLILTLTMSGFLLDTLSMTLYYGRNNRRYYVNGTVVTPRIIEDNIV